MGTKALYPFLSDLAPKGAFIGVYRSVIGSPHLNRPPSGVGLPSRSYTLLYAQIHS